MPPQFERIYQYPHSCVQRKVCDIAMESLTDQTSMSSSDGGDAAAQTGVKRLEAVSSTWTKTGLYMAYLGIVLIATTTSLEVQATTQLTIFATSSFSAHTLVSTVGVVSGVVLSVAKPPMSKFADVFGRFEAFTLAVVIYVAGYVQQALSKTIATYATAQIFYAAGSTGLQILIQIFIADTSDLVNRALCSAIPAVPFLFTYWAGPPIAQAVLPDWRLGYGIWAVILPVTFLPLGLSLCLNQRKAARDGRLPSPFWKDQSTWLVVKHLWIEMDAFGLILIAAAVSLIMIPLTLAGRSPNGWSDPSIIAMFATGALCMILVPLWECSSVWAPRAFLPRGLLADGRILAGFGIAFFYFMAFYLSVYPYFQSYLLVVMDLSVTTAGYIVQVFTFAATITSVTVSILIKYSKRYRIFVTIGSCIYVFGLAFMVLFRKQGASVLALVGAQIMIGVGGGMLHGPAQLGVQASASHQEVAAATAVFLTVLEIGGAAGNAISGAIWSHSVPPKLYAYLPSETRPQADQIFANISLAANGWPMGSPTRAAINLAYQETMTRLLIAAVVASLPCVVLSFWLEDYTLDQIDQHVTGVVFGGRLKVAERRGSAAQAGSSGARRSYVEGERTALLHDDDDDA